MNTGITLKQILLKDAETAYTVTEALFHKVDNSELSWKPATGTNWMTVGQLLMHCASYGCGQAVQGFVEGDWGMPDGIEAGTAGTEQQFPPASELPGVESVEQALDLLMKDRSITLRCLGEAEEADLLSKRLIAPWGGSEMSLFQHLHMMIAHLAQHKGQLFYYLKIMGKDVDTFDLWGA